MLLTIIIFILVLSLLVFVHEMGHFLVARRFGLKPEEFGFGFPPRVWGIYRGQDGKWKTVKGKKKVKDAADTIYSINWFPIGGFVKLGEDDIENSDDPNHFSNKPIWQRAIILLAGVTMNVVLAMALISFGYMIGLPQVLDDVHSSARISNEQIQIVEVMENSPAEQAKLHIGDIVLSVSGETFTKSDDLSGFVGQKSGQALNYKIKRGKEVFEIEIVPEIRPETNQGGIGIGIIESGLVRLPIHIAIFEGIKTTFYLLWVILLAFYALIKNLIIGQGVDANIAGPIGIAALTGQVARMGFVYILQFTAMLSINLAIINALPFPALDGGRVLFLIIEKIKGSPVKREIEAVIHNVGFALLMLLVLLVTFKDIARFGDGFKALWERIIS